jgi:hypothetical protein
LASAERFEEDGTEGQKWRIYAGHSLIYCQDENGFGMTRPDSAPTTGTRDFVAFCDSPSYELS